MNRRLREHFQKTERRVSERPSTFNAWSHETLCPRIWHIKMDNRHSTMTTRHQWRLAPLQIHFSYVWHYTIKLWNLQQRTPWNNLCIRDMVPLSPRITISNHHSHWSQKPQIFLNNSETKLIPSMMESFLIGIQPEIGTYSRHKNDPIRHTLLTPWSYHQWQWKQ